TNTTQAVAHQQALLNLNDKRCTTILVLDNHTPSKIPCRQRRSVMQRTVRRAARAYCAPAYRMLATPVYRMLAAALCLLQAACQPGIDAAIAASLQCPAAPATASAAPTLLPYTLVAHYPHRQDAFSQGLIYAGQAVIESTGRYGRSSLARIPLGASTPSFELPLEPNLFGEGLARVDNQLLQLTWKSGTVLRYQLKPDNPFAQAPAVLASGRIEGEGWGATSDGRALYTSDGSATITVRDPQTLQALRAIEVVAAGRPLRKLNELEWVNGCILANIWGSASIAVIDPTSGAVPYQIDLAEIARREQRLAPQNVANGIAYRDDNGNLLVTGKNWQYIYELQFASPGNKP
ncbi:MAG: glutaminyl-peptide cyclotransferase, partial [Gammaproteobacteria bacterium]|nr:glutaminyl-peptide cyclotransferase [Gammaproteobacteria bacterium]